MDNSAANNVNSLRELGFDLSAREAGAIERGKHFVQIRSGPFDLILCLLPMASRSSRTPGSAALIEGFPVCHIDDIIASKQAANRERDRESLPRLRAFREYWVAKGKRGS